MRQQLASGETDADGDAPRLPLGVWDPCPLGVAVGVPVLAPDGDTVGEGATDTLPVAVTVSVGATATDCVAVDVPVAVAVAAPDALPVALPVAVALSVAVSDGVAEPLLMRWRCARTSTPAASSLRTVGKWPTVRAWSNGEIRQGTEPLNHAPNWSRSGGL